jgi:hypothetical protein
VSVLPDPEMRRDQPAILDSPALYRGEAAVPAYEIKFLLSESEAREVERRLRSRMALDPHADPAMGNTYLVTSVYFDTPAFDVFRRSEGFRRRKFRVRQYGSAPTVFLEQKTKSQQRVRKRRTAVPIEELPVLDGAANGWPGAWFGARLTARGLRPVCRVSYQRLAFVGASPDGPLRLTFDRAAHGAAADGAQPKRVANGSTLLNDEVIAEFKFLGAMPAVFKSVIEGLQLTSRPVSKYRRCVEAVGLAHHTEARNA